MTRAKKYFKLACLISVFFLNLPSAPAQGVSAEETAPAHLLSFRDAVQKIAGYYPRLKAQHAKVEEAVASQYEAYAALLPKVEGLSSVTVGDDPVYVFGSLLRQESFTENNFALKNLNSPKSRTNFNFTLHGEMPLFNAFQTISRIRSSQFLLSAEKHQEQFTQMEASLLGLESYLKGLLAQENKKWAEASQNAGLNDLKQADELKEKGVVLGADFFAAKMMLAEIKQAKHQITADEKSAQVLLNILMGENPEALYQLTGKMPEKISGAKPLREWLEATYQSRPDLSAFQARVEAQKAETFREKMSALPKVGAFADLTEDTHDMKTGGENYLMGFRGKMELLDAGYWARRKKAKAQYAAVQAEYQGFKDQVSKDVSQAVNGFEAVNSSLPLAEEAFEDAREAEKQTEVLYREGRKSIMDLLEIRRAFLNTAFKRNELLFKAQMAYANLLFLSGKLDAAAMNEIAQQIDGA